VRRIVRVPKTAEGNLTEKEVSPPQRAEEKAISQKKRVG